MKSAQNPHYLWQHPDWTRLYYDMSALIVPLADVRQSLGVLIGKAQAIGLTQTNLEDVSNSIWIEEAIATATRDLTELLAKGALISRGVGKATKYYIDVIAWNLA